MSKSIDLLILSKSLPLINFLDNYQRNDAELFRYKTKKTILK